MTGGAGDDTFVVDDAGDAVFDYGGQGHDTVIASVNYTLISEVENLTLAASAGALFGTGNDLSNRIVGNASVNGLNGGAGDDWIDGGAGADVMTGGAGDDTFVVDDPGDAAFDYPGLGFDTVIASVSFTLTAGVENLTLAAGAGAINGTGNDGVNRIVGNASANSLTGGAGDDTFVFAAGEANGDAVTDFAGNGAAAGDQMQFAGYGSAAAGATLTQVDATHWSINSASGTDPRHHHAGQRRHGSPERLRVRVSGARFKTAS